MKAYFLSASLLTALYASHLCASPHCDQDSQSMPTHAPAPSYGALLHARKMAWSSDLALADKSWKMAIPDPCTPSSNLTDGDMTWAFASHIFATSKQSSLRDTARVDAFKAQLTDEQKIHASIILHMHDAPLNDENFAIDSHLQRLESQPNEAQNLVNILRGFAVFYSDNRHPLAYKAWNALTQRASLLSVPLSVEDYFSCHKSHLNAYTNLHDTLHLTQMEKALSASQPFLTTQEERAYFHKGMAEYFTLARKHQKEEKLSHRVGNNQCFLHWHKYWDQLDTPTQEQRNTYVCGLINAYDATGQLKKAIDVFDLMPDDLNEWNLLTLIFATQISLEVEDLTQATRYWKKCVEKAKDHDGGDDSALFLRTCFLDIASTMAMGGQLDLAIEALMFNLDAMHDKPHTGKSARAKQVIIQKSPSLNHATAFLRTHFLLSYTWAQKAIECIDPTRREAHFQTAMSHLRKSNFYNEHECAKEDAIRFISAMYFTILAAGTPQEKNCHLPTLFAYLGAQDQKLASSRGKARGVQKTSREDKGAKARTFLMKTYCDFADQHLKKLAQMTRKLEALGAPELSAAHKALTVQLKGLKRDAERPVIAQADAHVCLDTMARYNEANTKVQEYMSLWQTIERESAKARAALGVTGASVYAHSAPSSSSQPNVRGQFPHPKSSKKKAVKVSTRVAHPVPSSSSSPSASSQGSAPTQVKIILDSQAEKDMAILLTMPGMQAKLDAFLEEIRDNPFATKIDMATGRAEALRFMKDHYSRRFNKQNRLVYRTDKNDDGSVNVTVLRLLTHYKL
ncbi:MAG: type II toxin-antitoxin system YoeB family toxin [Proteobacteria bacterium]|nr:type II toxin-antitoxin system YoeB family toxin [Pseudomonadota bacterium]